MQAYFLNCQACCSTVFVFLPGLLATSCLIPPQTSLLSAFILVSLKPSITSLLIPAHSEGWSLSLDSPLNASWFMALCPCPPAGLSLFPPKFLHFSLPHKISVEYSYHLNFLFNYLKRALEHFLFFPFFLLNHSFSLLQKFGWKTGPVLISLTMVLNVFFCNHCLFTLHLPLSNGCLRN